jgi:AmpE protein
MNFLIVLLAIVALEAYSHLGALQRDDWLRNWHQALRRAKIASPWLQVLIFVTAPVLGLCLLISTLEHSHWGLLLFALDLFVLLYALGRGNLDTQIALFTSDLKRDDLQAAFHDAAVFNTAHRERFAESADEFKDEVFAALPYRIFERTFVVVFWFFFLGAPLALAYRLLALHGDMALAKARDEDENQVPNQCNQHCAKLLWLLEWLPARILGLTIGLVGDFSQTTSKVRELLFCRDTDTAEFLRRAVEGSLQGSDASSKPDAPLTSHEVTTMVSLFRRAMTAWLVVIAIVVILS